MKKLITLLETLEAAFVEIAIRAVSLLAPVPTAALVVTRTMSHLGWSQPVAIIAGIVIEGFGFSSINLTLTLYQYNQTKRQKDPKAPLTLSILFIAVYVVSVTGLTYFLDSDPNLARFAPLIFPLISLCGAGMMILRYNHTSRLQVVAQQKLQEKEARKEHATTRQVLAPPVSKSEQVLAYYRKNPLATQTQTAGQVGVSRQYVGQVLTKSQRTGMIKVNGNGVEFNEHP